MPAKPPSKKKSPPWAPYTVIRDTREKAGWDFPVHGNCQGTVEATLATGDYSLLGYEHLFTVERKGTVAEFAGNVFEARFERELERMDGLRYAFVVLEFTLEDLAGFPHNSGIPRYRWKYLKATPELLLKRLNDFQVKFRAKFIPAGTRAGPLVASLFKRITEAERLPWPGQGDTQPPSKKT